MGDPDLKAHGPRPKTQCRGGRPLLRIRLPRRRWLLEGTMLRGNVDEVRKSLPGLLTTFARKPLLYVPLDVGGHPKQVLVRHRIRGLRSRVHQRLGCEAHMPL